MIKLKILPESNVIDDGFLDLIGREFSTHEQGLAEWLKNAADATGTKDLAPGLETILLCFTDGRKERPAVLECVDFVGMTLEEIETAFKPWGRLSRHGEQENLYGGYGIGGKFYMRQMFQSACLITFSQGRINVFGFDQNHHYGYAEGRRNRLMDPLEALEFAGIGPLAEMVGMKEVIVRGGRGFSSLQGVGPKDMGNRIDVEGLCERLKDHPQAQSPLKCRRVCVIHNGVVKVERLAPRFIPRRPGFEDPWVRDIPPKLLRMDREVRLSANKESSGALRLFVSKESLVHEGKMASLNRIDFLGRDGVVASYRLEELGVHVRFGESIFGECRLPGLDHVILGRKTRDKLVDTEETRALLQWVRSQVIRFSHLIQRGTVDPPGERERKGSGIE